MAKLTDNSTTTETEVEQENQVQEIVQVDNTYYYDKLYDDKHLGSFTESTRLAYELGWQDNHVLITDTEVSEKNGWTYLKGYAPKKTTEEYFYEFVDKLDNARRQTFEDVAKEKGFSSSLECLSYAMASNSQRKTWALIYLAWRDKADAWYDDWIDNKLKLQAKVPNLEEVLAEMPKINWDAKLTEI